MTKSERIEANRARNLRRRLARQERALRTEQIERQARIAATQARTRQAAFAVLAPR